MGELRVNPTRMELKKLQNRYNTARRGHKLLKDKRDELMRQFLVTVKEYKEIRLKVDAALSNSYGSFASAAALMGHNEMLEALMIPKAEGSLNVTYKSRMNVEVPRFDLTLKSSNEGVNYGYAFTSGELDDAIEELSCVMQDMVKLAEIEKTAQILSCEIERTRRRVNALEYILMPQYLVAIKKIQSKLEENERGNTTRLMKVKDLVLKEKMQESIENLQE